MATISLSLGTMFEEAFGYRTQAFEFDEVPVRKNRTDTGTPYWSVDDFGREYYMPVWLDSLELPYPVISISERNMFVNTPMTERRGTVKENICSEDVVISVRGLIISKTNDYPEEIVRKLHNLKQKGEALKISNAITDIFLQTVDRQGYDKVVIESLRFPEVRGVMNVRPYEMQLVSDEDFSLIEV